MSESSYFTFFGALVSVVQLAAGTAAGWWFHRRFQSSKINEQRRGALSRLHDLSLDVADDVGRHSTRMDEICQELLSPNSKKTHSTPESLILDTVSQIVLANKRLHARLHSAEHQLREQAKKIDLHLNETRIDALTELPNRRVFDDEVNNLFVYRQNTGKPFSILLIDVDNFKQVNERFGHDAGDHALRHVSDVLTSTMRERDIVTRRGSDQFAVILTDTGIPEANRAAERARKAIQESNCRVNGQPLKITISVGAAEAGANDEPRGLFKRVDAALYAAKESGRNTGYFHDTHGCHPILNELPDCSADASGMRRSKSVVYAQYVAALGVDARTDPLTGLPNRRAFGDEIRRRITEARNEGHTLSLMLVGIDNINRLTALQGQDATDQVVRKVAQVLCAAVRDSDLVTRYGWEEFAIILPYTNYHEATRAHARVTAALAACTSESGDVTISTGLAELLADDDSVALAKRAEGALLKSRMAGGNCSHGAQSSVCEAVEA